MTPATFDATLRAAAPATGGCGRWATTSRSRAPRPPAASTPSSPTARLACSTAAVSCGCSTARPSRRVGLDVADGAVPDGRRAARPHRGPPPDVAAAAAELAASASPASPTSRRRAIRRAALLADDAGQPGFPLQVAVTGGAALAELDVGLPRGPVKVVLDEAASPLDVLIGWFRGPAPPAARSPCTA